MVALPAASRRAPRRRSARAPLLCMYQAGNIAASIDAIASGINIEPRHRQKPYELFGVAENIGVAAEPTIAMVRLHQGGDPRRSNWRYSAGGC